MPNGVKWIRSAVAEFAPEQNAVVLEDGERVSYRTLIVAAGIELNWDGVEGLRETLGKNGVTSNYMFEMAPYTFELVRSLRKGRALFSQPPMPIKCAGAPQKAMYLSCDHWLRDGVLNNIEVEFHLAHGEMLDLLRANGFMLERLIELFAPEDAETHSYYSYVSAEWAQQWPSEEIWVARKHG